MLRPALAVALVIGLAGCVSGTTTPGKVDVVAGFYPLAFLAERIGGDRVAVRDLTPPGAEPHEVELSPRQVAAVHDSDLLLYLSGLAPALDDAAGEAPRRLDVARVADLADGDPHVWLDPDRMRRIATALREQLVAVDPDHEGEYVARGAALDAELAALDTDLRRGLADCEQRALVTTHAAFGYLARRYDLSQVALSGISPDQEPAPGRLAEVTTYVREHEVRTVFSEALLSPKAARLLAASAGARTAVLDPLETAPADGDYVSAMRANLAVLREGLGCR